jgi:predicted nucleic acid-binding protein
MQVWDALEQDRTRLVTTSYVLLETFVLLQSRVGLQGVRAFAGDFVPRLEVNWVDQDLHDAGVAELLALGRTGLSLVDCVSFCLMRQLGLRRALTVDAHFREQGFECLPETA